MAQLIDSFGQVIFYPYGIIFILLVIIAECMVVSKLISFVYINKNVWIVVFVANWISATLEYLASYCVDAVCWPVLWLPLVSNYDIAAPCDINTFIIYYFSTFLITIIIEIGVLLLMFRNKYRSKEVVKATMLSNLLTFIFGSLVMYSCTFFC